MVDEGQTALILAVKAGHECVIRALIQHCTGINAIDRHGKTADKWAKEKNFPRILKLLSKTKACKID
ncbi:MAG: ankyrin repeat domain-containing protein [Deltaproteobacteria bacterium]|nr:MAG: ankyrin repeat domain-containing protein [Deltaproteobacteria bacterium]